MLERQREGIARAKGEGKYKGRPASIDAAEIQRLTATMGPAAIAKHLGIARSNRLSAARAGRVTGDTINALPPDGQRMTRHVTALLGLAISIAVAAHGSVAATDPDQHAAFAPREDKQRTPE